MDKYLSKYKCSKGTPFTHTRIGNPSLGVYGGIYYIPDDQLQKFYTKYHEHIFIQNGEEYLTEKQKENGPLLIDVDFRYSTDVTERQHNDEHIIQFLELIVSKISKIYVPKENEFNIYVLEKKTPNLLDDVTKDGIHIMIDIEMDFTAKTLLRNFILDEIHNVWSELDIINTWDDVLDIAVMNGNNNWQLFGSQKPGHEKYELTYWYSLSFDEDCQEWDMNKKKISDFDFKNEMFKLSCRHMPLKKLDFNPTIKPQYDNLFNLKKNKMFKKKVIKSKVKSIQEITCQEDIDALVNVFLEECENHHKELHQYTMLLSKEYYDAGSYNNWIRVGWALKNTDEKLLITWIKLSSKSDSFDYTSIQEDLIDRWDNFDKYNEDGLSSKSIIYWAKLSNPEEFQAIKNTTIDYHVEKTLQFNTEFDIANLLYQIYKDQFVCASIKDNIWYEFIGNRWVVIDSGNSLRFEISTTLYDLYFNKITELGKKIRSLQTNQTHLASAIAQPAPPPNKKDDNVPPELGNLMRIKEIYETIANKKLRTTNQKNNIMREAKEIFYDKNFMKKVDRNKYLLCFNNCVIDFKNNEIRPGRPDDYITMSTNTDFIISETDEYSDEFKNNGVKLLKSNIPKYREDKFERYKSEIIEFMEQLFPDDEDNDKTYSEVRRYVWEHLSSTLLGTIENQTFNIYNGSGANGKSKLVELMGMVLGEYKGTVPISLITQKRNSIGGTSSEVAQLIGVRYAVMQEPSRGDVINEGIMKEITGGDPIQCRQLFRESQVFEPQFKLVVCTNTLFEVNSQDDGTWRRIRVVDFPSKFVKNPYTDKPRDNYPYQYEVDYNINEKFEKWAPVFMNMLVKIAFAKRGKVIDCKKVMEKSNEYRKDKDVMNDFATECIEACPGGKIMKRNLNEVFSNWSIDKYHNKKDAPTSKELHEWMTQRYGKYNGGWKNIQIRIQMEEE